MRETRGGGKLRALDDVDQIAAKIRPTQISNAMEEEESRNPQMAQDLGSSDAATADKAKQILPPLPICLIGSASRHAARMVQCRGNQRS